MGRQPKSGARPKKRDPRKKKKTSPAAAPEYGGSFSIPYGNAVNLANIGPYFTANWSVPQALEDALKASGKPVPPVVSGAMLVDTGADLTCIAEDVAIEMGLQAVDRRKILGVGGSKEHTIYAAKLTISIRRRGGQRSVVWITIQAAGIPKLREHFEARGVNVNGQPLRLIGLLGRDMLRYSKMIYRGETGTVDYTFDFTPLIDKHSK